MKLYLRGHNYIYSVEQTALMLFPELNPVYATEEPSAEGETGDYAVVSLTGREATAKIFIGERSSGGGCEVVGEPGNIKEETYAVRTAFYRAALPLLPSKPLWGALSGVRPSKLLAGRLAEGRERLVAYLEARYDMSREKAEKTYIAALYSEKAAKMLEKGDYCLYVGIPFCPSKCRYCSFITRPCSDREYISKYLASLEKELRGIREKYVDRRLRAIYVGGGTPAILDEAQLSRLMEMLGLFNRESLVEFSVEMGRPELITRGKLEVLEKAGVGRICINPQTLTPDVLEKAGRNHTTGDFFDACERASHFSFSVNNDLIAGLEGETEDSFEEAVKKLIELSPDNITVHALSKKRSAALEKVGNAGVAEMISRASERLAGAGYEPYYLYRQKNTADGSENTGFTKVGKESFYNIVMMNETGDVVSAGAGGVTKIVSNGVFRRETNPKDAGDYIRKFTL